MSLLKTSNSIGCDVKPFEFGAYQPSDQGPLAEPQPSQADDGQEPNGLDPLANEGMQTHADLERQIAELETALAEAVAASEQQKTASYEAGKAKGIESANDLAQQQIEQLADAIAKAHEVLANRFDSQLNIAIDIARAVLRKIFGNQDFANEALVSTARHWSAELASATILRVSVSEEQFAEAADLDALTNAIGKTEIIRDPALPPGSCLFDLQLGKFDASLPTQLAKADAVLDEARAAQTEVQP